MTIASDNGGVRIDGRTLSHETCEQSGLMAVRRVRDGERQSDMMRRFGLCRTRVYPWLRADREEGEAALAARKHVSVRRSTPRGGKSRARDREGPLRGVAYGRFSAGGLPAARAAFHPAGVSWSISR